MQDAFKVVYFAVAVAVVAIAIAIAWQAYTQYTVV